MFRNKSQGNNREISLETMKTIQGRPRGGLELGGGGGGGSQCLDSESMFRVYV